MELFARTLQTLEPKTREQVVELKATLWALVSIPRVSLHPLFPLSLFLSLRITRLPFHRVDPSWLSSPLTRQFQVTDTCYFFQGHVGSTNWGINFLVEEAVIPEIVRLAEECANFAIRGYIYDARISTVLTQNIFRFIRADNICTVSLLSTVFFYCSMYRPFLVTKYI